MSEKENQIQQNDAQKVFVELGKALLSSQFGSVKLSDDEAERVGRSWFKSVLPVLKKHICGNQTINDLLLSETASARNTLIIATLQTVLAGVFAGIPVLTISHAAVNYGIKKICADKS